MSRIILFYYGSHPCQELPHATWDINLRIGEVVAYQPSLT